MHSTGAPSRPNLAPSHLCASDFQEVESERFGVQSTKEAELRPHAALLYYDILRSRSIACYLSFASFHEIYQNFELMAHPAIRAGVRLELIKMLENPRSQNRQMQRKVSDLENALSKHQIS